MIIACSIYFLRDFSPAVASSIRILEKLDDGSLVGKQQNKSRMLQAIERRVPDSRKMETMGLFFDLTRHDYDCQFADASIHGSYSKEPPCSLCGTLRRQRIRPMVIEWEPGSDIIADFTWPAGLGELVISDSVKKALEDLQISSISFGPVEMYQDPKLRIPTRPNARTKPRMWLPYTGPKLWDLEVSSYCHLNLKKSGRTLRSKCEACKTKLFDVEPGASTVIDRDTWDGAEIFRIHEIGKVVFVFQDVKPLLEGREFTNVQIRVRGKI